MKNSTCLLGIALSIMATAFVSCNRPEQPYAPEIERIELKLPFVADTTSVEIEGINDYQIGEAPKWLEIKQNEEGIELITKENGEKDIEEVSAKVMLTSEEKTIELDITKEGCPTYNIADYDFKSEKEMFEISLDDVYNAHDILVISLDNNFYLWEKLQLDNKTGLYDDIMEMVQETDYPYVKHYSDFENNKVSIHFDTRNMFILILAVDENHYAGKINEMSFV